ncbi:hypothetical protein U1Q18_037661 [Sarracenia purpurea var. burkii]
MADLGDKREWSSFFFLFSLAPKRFSRRGSFCRNRGLEDGCIIALNLSEGGRRCRNRGRRAEVDAKDGRSPDYGGCAG